MAYRQSKAYVATWMMSNQVMKTVKVLYPCQCLTATMKNTSEEYDPEGVTSGDDEGGCCHWSTEQDDV